MRPEDNQANIKNKSKSTDGTNEQYDQAVRNTGGLLDNNAEIQEDQNNLSARSSYSSDSVVLSQSTFNNIANVDETVNDDLTEMLSTFYSDLSKKQSSLPCEAQEIIESNLWDLYIKS